MKGIKVLVLKLFLQQRHTKFPNAQAQLLVTLKSSPPPHPLFKAACTRSFASEGCSYSRGHLGTIFNAAMFNAAMFNAAILKLLAMEL